MSHGIDGVGCIGAGVLGAAIMRRLIDRGFAPLLWNRDRSKLAPLLKADATEAMNPAELTRASTFVITCVSDGAAIEQIVFGEKGVAEAGSSEKVLIDMSTCAAAHTQDMASRLTAKCGMAWLDAPISGGAPAALEGRMAVMIGGREDVFERARPIWDALAGRATLMGPNGAGQATKMINQVLVSTGVAVLARRARSRNVRASTRRRSRKRSQAVAPTRSSCRRCSRRWSSRISPSPGALRSC